MLAKSIRFHFLEGNYSTNHDTIWSDSNTFVWGDDVLCRTSARLMHHL